MTSWCGLQPRGWQTDAYHAWISHVTDKETSSEPGIISAIMGSGKSLVIAELCHAIEPKPDNVVIVSTSSQRLVRSLKETISRRLSGIHPVSAWYQHEKRLAPVIVSCMPSLRGLVWTLRHEYGKKVKLWIPDEAHKSQADSVLAAHKEMEPGLTCGFTATPFRSDQYEHLQLFETCLYRYGVADALRDGVIVPWRIVSYQGDLSDIDRCCIEMITDAEGAGIVNATDIADAEDFSAKLQSVGIRAATVHSGVHDEIQEARLEELRSGEIGCVVYVNMLSEGVDFPWLRWMCLRREVKARVRFMQEVGRLLRSSFGKDEAVIYDPHDLFGYFRLNYAEALGEPPDRPTGKVVSAGEAKEKIESDDPAVVLAWIEAVVRTLTVACDVAGWTPNRRTIPKAERLKPATPSQRAVLESLWHGAYPYMDSGWGACLTEIIGRKRSFIRFGFAADLIEVLCAVVDQGKWCPVDEEGRIVA